MSLVQVDLMGVVEAVDLGSYSLNASVSSITLFKMSRGDMS